MLSALYFRRAMWLDRDMNAWLRQHWLSLLAIVLLLGALAPLPYVYYQIMNWVVAIAALRIAYHGYKYNEWLLWPFVAVAIVFNPIAPLYFTALVWQIADVVVALLFVASFFVWRTVRTHTA